MLPGEMSTVNFDEGETVATFVTTEIGGSSVKTSTPVAGFAATSTAVDAGGHKWGDVPPHGHVMLIGVEVFDGAAHYDRCVEFKALPVPAHHGSIHTGKAGGSPFAQGALFDAGNWVIPLPPFVDLGFTGCENVPNPFPLP